MASTWRRRFFWFSTILLLLFGAGLWALYSAAREVPEFYAAALDIPPTMAESACDQFSDQAFALANDVKKEGAWSALFTDEQINGWLATDLVTKHPQLLPPGFEHPRVKLSENHGQVGVRYTVGCVKTVAWIDVEATMTTDGEIALRFRNIRAGAVPIPLASILDAVSRAAADLEVPLRWTGGDDEPTAVIGLPQPKRGLRYELTKLKLGDGQLYISGHTTKESWAMEAGETR